MLPAFPVVVLSEDPQLANLPSSFELPSMAKKPAFQFAHLSLPERLQLVEDLWDSIAEEADGSTLPLSEEEKALLDKRLADLEANPQIGSTWEEVRARIEKLGR